MSWWGSALQIKMAPMQTMRFSRLALALSLAAFLSACGAKEPPAVAHAASSSPSTSGSTTDSAVSPKAAGEVKPAGEAKLGDKTKCPASGDEFVVTESSPKVEHEGKTYYFCCPSCAVKFNKDPSHYLDAK